MDLFYPHLLHMLFSDAPRILQDQLTLMVSLQNLEEESPILHAQICQDMTYLHAQDEEPLYLVFDDFQWVADRPAFSDMFAYFVANMPDCVRIILTSRTDPGFLTGKLCLNHRCRRYTSQDFLFEPEEVEELIDQVYRFPLTKEQMELVTARSKGWAAGIYILCHSLQAAPADPETDSSFSDADSLFSRFFREYLLSIPEEKQALLMELSFLDDFSADELAEIFQWNNPAEFLRWLETHQLCFKTVSEEKTRFYFHSLLAEELRKLYSATRALAEQKALFKRIGDYYQTQDLYQAVSFYILAKEETLSIESGVRFAKECFRSGQPDRFFPILSLYSEEQISANPYLLLMEGMKALHRDRVRAQLCFVQSMEGFRRLRDFSYLMNSFGMLLVVAYQLNDFDLLKEASKKIPIVPILLKGGPAVVPLVISYFISLIGKDNLNKAAPLARYLDRKTISEQLWQFSYLMIRGIYFYRQGDLAASEKNMECILAHPVPATDDQWRTIGLVSCCNLAFLQADLDRIQFFVNEFMLLAERLQSDFALGYAHYMRSFAHYLQSDIEEALSALLLSKEAFQAYGSELLTMETECLSFLMSQKAESDQILRMRTIVDRMKQEQPGHGMEEFSNAVLGILLKRQGNFREAEKRLTESLSVSVKKGAAQSAYAIRLQLADLCFSQGRSSEGQEHFRKWVDLGKKHGYRYGRTFTHDALCRIAETIPQQWETCSYCHEVQQFYERTRKKATSERVLEICFLGPFSLRFGSVCITEKDFKTRKVSGLLKYILAREQPQSREHLAGVFWPESDRKSAGTSLRVALYELRKTLTGIGMGFNTENALLAENKDGFSVCCAPKLQTDTQKMEDLYNAWRQSSEEPPLDLLMNICDLYQGPFLEKGEYGDWVTIQREYYAGIYYEALHALGDIAVRSHCTPAADYLLRGLELDPLDETGYAHLIALYENEGQFDRAESLRRQFKKRFKGEMGFEASL